ncbi:MAG TPA: hypothetical protein VGH24_05815 [Solirubrobacteraceae bacterium]|jgi:hypothetical protein
MIEQTAKPRPRGAEQQQAQQDGPPHGARSALIRIVLGVLTTLVSVNLWTGGPLFALWVGSRVQASIGTLSMAAVGATIGVLIVVTFVLYRLLAWLHVQYNAAIGRTMARRQAPWLKPMSGERRSNEVREPLSAVERIVILSVVAAVLVFEIWFFFFAHYTLVS